jgi:membrane protease YdiL (CAAX protease family)
MTRDVPWPRFLAGFAVLWSVLYGLGRLGSTSMEHGLIATLVMIALAAGVEVALLGRPREQLTVRLGLGRPAARSMTAAAVVSLIVVAALPVYAHLSGEALALRPGWPWLVAGLLAYHGIAEEVCWRGYAFGHLRNGRTFRSAVVATMPLIALTHVPIVLESGLAVGLVAVVVAAVTCIPLAHLYVLGNTTIWPAALVHAAIDAWKLVDTGTARVGLSLAVAAAALACPFLALAWRTRPSALPCLT